MFYFRLKFGPISNILAKKEKILKKIGFVSYILLPRLSLMLKFTKILCCNSKKNAKLSIPNPKLSKFGQFWSNQNFLKTLHFVNHLLLPKLEKLVPLPHERVWPTRYSDALQDSVDVCIKDFYRIIFSPKTASL